MSILTEIRFSFFLIKKKKLYLIVTEREQLLSQSIAILLFPFLGQKGLNGIAALKHLVTVPPNRVWCVGHLDPSWVPVQLCPTNRALIS